MRGVRPPVPRHCLTEQIRWHQCQAGGFMLQQDAPFNIRSGHRCDPNTVEERAQCELMHSTTSTASTQTLCCPVHSLQLV
jgi:hypothetical protein